jgi:hypothetical protein
LKFKRSAQHAFEIISIVALILRHCNSWALFFSSSAFAQVPVKIFSTRGVFDTETGEMLPQATPLPIADTLLDLDEQGCPGEIVTYVHGVTTSS